MTREPPPQLWQVFSCGWKDSWSAFWPELPNALRRRFATPAALQASHHAHEGQRFLIGPDGRPDARVNAFFASATMGARSAHTNRKYAYSVGMWLNFLLRHRSARRWFEAERDEFEDFTHWRMTDERNPRPVTEARGAVILRR